MLKEITGDMVADENIRVIVRDGYRSGMTDTDFTRELYERYPKIKRSDEENIAEKGLSGSIGSMVGAKLKDGRMVITWYLGEDAGGPVDFDDVVRVSNMFNQYIDRSGLPGNVGIPEGMGGEQWDTVRRAIGEIADLHLTYDFYIVKPEDDKDE